MKNSINDAVKQKMITARFMISIILFFSSLFYGETLFAKRVAINDIGELAEVLKNLPPDSLVIFDVDEVLVYPENVVQLQIAAPFWEATMADLEKRRGKATRDLLHSINRRGDSQLDPRLTTTKNKGSCLNYFLDRQNGKA